MDLHFYLLLESRIEGQKDKPLVDVICGFLEGCASRHLAASKGWSKTDESGRVQEEKDYFTNDLRRRVSRWQHAVKAGLERVVVDSDPVKTGEGRLGRSVEEIEKAIDWLNSNEGSFADTLISDSIAKFEEPSSP